MIREMELLFQASRTSPMLHEAAVVVEEGIAALRTERDELVLQNERLGDDIVAAEARCARLEAERNEYAERLQWLRDLREREGSWGKPYERAMATSDCEYDAGLVLAAITKGYHPGGHHPNCETGEDEGCDCYATTTLAAREALARLVARAAVARAGTDNT